MLSQSFTTRVPSSRVDVKGDIQGFLTEARELIGEDHVVVPSKRSDPMLRTVSGMTRDVPAVVRPGNAEDVRALVLAANAFQVPLYPISSGRNWGLGGPLPVRDGCAIVDLSRMNRILEINDRHGYAVIEPGVTQGQLHKELRKRKLRYVFNVTGSGLETSILGNALDRGVGYFSSRASEISNLEVVLGNGRVLRTGFGRFRNAKAASLYSYGVGPALDGIFAQSNLGIVTRATFELIPMERVQGALMLGISDPADLPRLVDAVARLRRGGFVRTAIHVANRARSEATLTAGIYRHFLAEGMEPDEAEARATAAFRKTSRFAWTAIGGLLGTRHMAREAVREARRLLKGFGRAVLLTDRKLTFAEKTCGIFGCFRFFQDLRAALSVVRPLYGLSKGTPTDMAIDSVYWPVRDREGLGSRTPQHSTAGLRYALPIVPLDGTCAREVVDICETIARGHGFQPYITFNALNDGALEGVINIAYTRTLEHSARTGEACMERMREALSDRGYYPYRVSIDQMAAITDANDPFWQTVRGIKRRLDPNGIIAPGRYNLA